MRRRMLASVLGVAAVGLVGVLAYGFLDAWGRERLQTQGSGWGALVMLLLCLAVTPAARIFPRLRRSAVPLRRATGVASAALASAHLALALVGPLQGAYAAIFSWAYLRAGLVALAILLVLGVTSFSGVVRALRVRLWKPLHRLVYAAAVVVVLHLALSPFASPIATIAVAVVVVSLLGSRVLR